MVKGISEITHFTERAEDGSTTFMRDLEGQTTVAMARSLRAQGLTFRQIAAEMERAGRRTKRGGRWEAETVSGFCGVRNDERLLRLATCHGWILAVFADPPPV